MSNGILFNKDILSQIRERFACVESDPLGGKRIYLENAGGSLVLKDVLDIVAKFTALPDNAGRNNVTSQQIDDAIAKGLEDVKTFVGARSGIVALGESTTSNAFKILTPVIMNVPGNNVVTTDLDHPSIYDATQVLAERYNKRWRSARLSQQKGIVVFQSVIECIDSQTIVLAIIHSSNNVGTKNNIKRIIQEARKVKPDLYVIVDGSQYCTHSLIDVDDLGCDGYLISSYKTFSKIGATAFYLSDRASQLPHNKLGGKSETHWELGTREPAGYAAWSVVMDYLCWLGGHFTKSKGKRELVCAAMHAIEEHERALTHSFLKGTDDIEGMLDIDGLTVFGEVEDLMIKDPVFLFNVHGMSSADVVSALASHGIRVHNRINDAYSRHTLKALGTDEGVRVSAAHYNSPQEVVAFLKALKEIIK